MGISKDENGTYKVEYWKRHPKTSKPTRIARQGIKTKAEAKRVYRQLIVEMEAKFHKQEIPTWKNLVLDFYDANETRTQKTMDNFLVCIKAHTFRRWGDRTVYTITTQEIRVLIQKKLAEKSPSHRKNILKFIRWVFTFGVELGVINRNPVPDMKFQVGDKIKKVLTQQQVAKFLNQAKAMNVEWFPHWAMAVYTGMRNGELYALTWDKVNFENRQMLVNCSWNKQDGVKSTKTGNDRLVEIAPPLLPILKELKVNSADSLYVLPRIDKWDKGEQARELRVFLMGLGLPVIRFHDLRATWATIMLSNGVQAVKVMVMGGWTDIKTMKYYIRKAGVDIKGMTDGLNLHDPQYRNAKVLKFK